MTGFEPGYACETSNYSANSTTTLRKNDRANAFKTSVLRKLI